MTIMTVYKVRISRYAMRDMDDLEDYLKSVMSQIGANKYIDNMIAEVQSLVVYADLYRPSTMADIRQYHPGIFCKFGSFEESRPVAVPVCIYVV